MWQWVDGPLTAAFYPDNSTDDPQPLLYSNHLVGSVQLRQVRVHETPCTDLVTDLDPSVTCAPRWNLLYEDLQPYGGTAGLAYTSTTFDSTLLGPKIMYMSTVGDSASEDFGEVRKNDK